MNRIHEWMVKYEPEFVFVIMVAMLIEVAEVYIQIRQGGPIP